LLASAASEPSYPNKLKAVKAISFKYASSPELRCVLEEFRLMCNDAIKIALEEKPTSRFNLNKLAYSRLKQYGLHSHFLLSACEVAYSLFKNKKRRSTPYVRNAFLKLDNQTYQLNHLLLRIPSSPNHSIFLSLKGSAYHLSFVDNQNLKRGSVIITDDSVTIAFSKEIELSEPEGYVGVDINERNVTVSATDGHERRFNGLREIVEIKETYREIRAKIDKVTRQDNRIKKELLAKYGRREKNRTAQRIHQITKEIVNYSAEHRLGSKMENLTGIRRLYRKGNFQNSCYRARMNSWVFGETQREIDYKGTWLGVPVYYVNPRGTSSHCLCGSRVVHLADRKLYCQKCDRTWDRDDLASKNIMACAVPQARPSKKSGEGERGDDGSNPRSGWMEAKLGGRRQYVRLAEPNRCASTL